MSSIISPSVPTSREGATVVVPRPTIGSAGQRTGSRGAPTTPNRVIRTPTQGAQLVQLAGPTEFSRRTTSGEDLDEEIYDETERRQSAVADRCDVTPPPRQSTQMAAADSYSTDSRSESPYVPQTPPQTSVPPQQARTRERPPLMSSHDVESPASPDPPKPQPEHPALRATVASPDESQIPKRVAPASGPPTTPPRVTLGKKELIGAGSFGSVYKALDLETNRTVAVKEIRLQHLDESPQAQREIAQLEREIKVMQKLSHPNIVKYLGYTRGEGTFNIHMEFVPCGTIASLLRTFGPLSPIQAALFTRQILAGLQYLHERHIIHRDLKGDNLFVDTDGTLKVGDFGTAKELQTVRQAHSVAGTPYFMAPEVVRNGGHGLEADVWSLGCCVIQMLSGQPPYRSFDNQITVMFQVSKGNIESQIPPDIPEDAKDFIRCCCKLKPEDRLTVAQLMNHPWLASAPPPPEAAVKASVPPLAPKGPATRAHHAKELEDHETLDAQKMGTPRNLVTSSAKQSPPPVSSRPTSGTGTPRMTTPKRTPVPSTLTPVRDGSGSRGVAAVRAARKTHEERPSGPGIGRRATPKKTSTTGL